MAFFHTYMVEKPCFIQNSVGIFLHCNIEKREYLLKAQCARVFILKSEVCGFRGLL